MKPLVSNLVAALAVASSRAKNLFVVGMLVLAASFFATLMPSVCSAAEDARVAKSMAALKEQTAKLGAPKIEGTDAVGGKDAPALYFGSTKMNNNSAVVDAVAKEGGEGMAATLFVKGGDEYIRVATTLPKALGTVLTGPALDAIKAGKDYYAEAPVLGTPYITGYEPIKDASGAILGIYFVGYKK